MKSKEGQKERTDHWPVPQRGFYSASQKGHCEVELAISFASNFQVNSCMRKKQKGTLGGGVLSAFVLKCVLTFLILGASLFTRNFLNNTIHQSEPICFSVILLFYQCHLPRLSPSPLLGQVVDACHPPALLADYYSSPPFCHKAEQYASLISHWKLV